MKQQTSIGLIAGIGILAAVAWITASGINNTTQMSDLMIKNLEALTRDEGGTVEVPCIRWSDTCETPLNFSDGSTGYNIWQGYKKN